MSLFNSMTIRSLKHAAVFIVTLGVAAACFGETKYQLTNVWLGDTTVERDEGAVYQLLDSLNARKGYQAELLQGHPSWMKKPGRMGDGRWLSSVVVSDGYRRDWLLVMWSEDGKTIERAIRRAGRTSISGVRTDQYRPGPNQISVNSARELIADWAQPVAERTLGKLRIAIKPWDGQDIDSLLEGDLLADSGPVSQLPNIEQREAVQALAHVAAYEIGFSPTVESAAPELQIELAREPAGFAMRLTYGKQTQLLRHIPREFAYAHLMRLIRSVTQWGSALKPICQIDSKPFNVMHVDGETVIGQSGGALLARNTSESKTNWETNVTDRATYHYRAFDLPKGQRTVVQLSRSLLRVDLTNGREVDLPRPPAGVVEYDMSPDQTLAVLGDDGSLNLVPAEGESRPVPVTGAVAAGPRLVDGTLLYATRDGRLVGVRVVDLKELFSVSLSMPINGPMEVAGNLAFVSTGGNQVAAVDIAAGKFKWQIESDRLLSAPTVMGDKLLLVDRSNHIRIVSAADGSVIQQHHLLQWIVAAIPHGNTIACLTQQGNVELLDLRTLEPTATYRLDASPTHTFHVAGKSIYFGDNDGFVYALQFGK